MSETENKVRNVVVVGSGPSGWTAALYLARANLKPLLYAGAQVGGQLTTTTEIENFPGFPKGIEGPELMIAMEEQAKRFGTDIEYAIIEEVDLTRKPFVLKSGDTTIRAHTVIISTGASPRLLGLESEKTFWNRGVHTCAVCDGGFYRNKAVVVVGGGDSAMEEATYLANLASKVYVVHRRDSLRASKIMADRALENPKIEFVWNSAVEELIGDGGSPFARVKAVRVRNLQSEMSEEIEASAMFVAIGHIPNSGFLGGAITTDENHYVIVNDSQETNIPGVFAAGDIHDHRYRQAITAAGYGCKAALEVEKYLTREGLLG